MRTYDETFDRVMAKKAAAEKERQQKNKKAFSVCVSTFVLIICAVSVYAAKNGFNKKENITQNTVKPVEKTTSYSVEETTAGSVSADKTEKTKPYENDRTLGNKQTESEEYPELKTTADSAHEITAHTENLTTAYEQTTRSYSDGEDVLREEARREDVRRIRFALSAVDEKDRDKIDIDKSFCADLYGDESGEEYLVMHLEGDTFYYEVTILADVSKVISSQKKVK